MMGYKGVICICAGLLSGICAVAQNFNESVEVTNDLVVDMSGLQRKTIEIQVPDSLSEFKLKFDYSVFSKPYKGAYEFTPYNVLFRPISSEQRAPWLYVNAGAGFAFAPVVDIVANVKVGEKLHLGFYQDFDAYVGSYRGKSSDYSGYELSERVGACGYAFLKPFNFFFDTFYQGMWVRDLELSGDPFHAFGFQGAINSDGHKVRSVDYELNVDYRFSKDYSLGLKALGENALELKGRVSPLALTSNIYKFDLYYETGLDVYSGISKSGVKYIKMNPRMTFDWGKAKVSVGVKASNHWYHDYTYSFRLYPDLEASFALFNAHSEVLLGMTGYDQQNSHYTFKQANPHFNASYFETTGSELKESREYLNAFLGLRGSVKSCFQYDFRAGYADKGYMPLYALRDVGNTSEALRLVYGRYDGMYLTARLLWHLKSWDIKSYSEFQDVSLNMGSDAFMPAAFRTSFDMTYNKMERIFAGVSIDYMGERRSKTMGSLPQYIDVGLHGEYRMNKDLSFWLKAENILGQRVESVPFTSRRFPVLTVGLRLILS